MKKNEKEDLINKLNNIINEKIQLSKIYDKYINIQNLNSNSKQKDEINISSNSNKIPEKSNINLEAKFHKRKFDNIEDERKSVEKSFKKQKKRIGKKIL